MDLENISLARLYKRQKTDRDIFQELMPTKVKEVLLIATLYDSYSIVREGQFSDKIFGEYLQLNLYAAPRFTSVNSKEEALQALSRFDFDLIIVMAGVDKKTPVETARELRNARPRIPLLLLVNNNADLRYFQAQWKKLDFIDRIFVWNGNSNVFIAMIKYIEDIKNVAFDTKNGNVRVILLVEDSIQYYSRYLPMLYTNIMTQTQNLVEDKSADELHKIMKLRARPKVILVSNYEEAVLAIKKYKKHLLSVISDVKFPRNEVDDEEAGVDLVEIAPMAQPPVCRIMDYGKFKYQEQKRQHEQKLKQKQVQVKEIKFRPGTDENDYQIKLRNMTRFLQEEDKVKVTLRFRGRELSHQEFGMRQLERVKADLESIGSVEQMPKMEGRQMVMVIAPVKKAAAAAKPKVKDEQSETAAA